MPVSTAGGGEKATGIGKMRPNAVMMGFLKDWKEKDVMVVREYELMLRSAQVCGLGVMVVRYAFSVFCRQKPPACFAIHQIVLTFFNLGMISARSTLTWIDASRTLGNSLAW